MSNPPREEVLNLLRNDSPTFKAIVDGAHEAGAADDPVLLIGLLCVHLDAMMEALPAAIQEQLATVVEGLLPDQTKGDAG